MRPAHKLSGNDKTNIPERIITYDCETFPIPNNDLGNSKAHYLKLGVARFYLRRDSLKERNKIYENKEEITFHIKEEFWEFVEARTRNRKITYVFSHNQQFDALVVDMYHELPKRGWELEHNIVDSNIFIVRWNKGTHENKKENTKSNMKVLIFIDTLNYFKTSIKEIGKMLNLPKGEINFEKCSMEELEIYCKRDVEITETILLQWLNFIEDNDLGNFQATVASQAFSAFRHRFMEHDIYIHDNQKAIDLERISYRGGRNEAFFIGHLDQHITVLDFNSLYPSVMLGKEYPINLKGFRVQNDLSTLSKTMKDYLVIAELTIKLERPLVAIRRERLIFPIGTFSGTFCTPEIEVLLKRGLILSVGKISFYESARIFDDYVDFFYSRRLKAKQANDKVKNDLFKIMLNSLYGKFGQRYKDLVPMGETNPDISKIEFVYDDEKKERYIRKTFAGKVFRNVTTKEESHNSFPAIASFCTAYARMKLLHSIEKAGWDNVFYVDTDSLFVNDIGLKNLHDEISPMELGKLKVEYDAPNMTIKGCKDYIINDVATIKGIPKNAIKLSENSYELLKFDKFNASLHHDTLDHVTERHMVKILSRKYTKGIIQSSGLVSPIPLDETKLIAEESEGETI